MEVKDLTKLVFSIWELVKSAGLVNKVFTPKYKIKMPPINCIHLCWLTNTEETAINKGDLCKLRPSQYFF